MTMLDRMRRHKGWLKWSLALVVLPSSSSRPEFVGPSQTCGHRAIASPPSTRYIPVATFAAVYGAGAGLPLVVWRQSTDELLQRCRAADGPAADDSGEAELPRPGAAASR
jgi:hypothetical protein